MFDNPLSLLIPERIEIINKIESKKCAFDLLTELLAKDQNEVGKNEIFDALITREKLGKTCSGHGIAIPRAHIEISKPLAALLIIKKGLEIETVDKKPIKLFLALIVPENQSKKYSNIIKKLNFILADDDHHKVLIESDKPEDIAIYFESLLNEAMKDDVVEEKKVEDKVVENEAVANITTENKTTGDDK